jgi:hypothetical protein
MNTLRSPALALALLAGTAATLLRADPSEAAAAWPNAPRGFHWDMLGPRTTAFNPARYAVVRHVSSAGSDETGDGSRTKPWRTVQRAFSAPPVDGRSAVLVAAGLYEANALRLRAKTDLYGGFTPGAWTRDIFQFQTILRGSGSDRVLLGADDCVFDGFVIENGAVRGHGGALLCDGVSPVISNNVFRRNRTLVPADYPQVTDRRRIRGHDGGAVALLNGANADVRHNLFHDNETGIGYGGALSAAHDCLPIIGHNVFWGNRAGVADVNITRSGNGGAIGLLFSSRAAVMHNLFAANSTLGDSDGGALFLEYYCWSEIACNAFVHNRADDDGGGLDHQKFSYVKIRANLFYGNEAGKSGGGVHGDDSSAELENNIFAHNEAERNGGGIGGTHSWLRALNNTLAHNEAPRGGGGIQIVNVKNPFLRPSIFRNNLLAFNTPDQVRFDSEADAAYNIMHPGGHEGGYYNFPHPPGFRDDGRRFTVRSIRFDGTLFTTTVAVAESLEPGVLTGRIARAGAHWSMVRANTAGEITLWGPAPPDAAALEILPTYRLAPDSRAIKRGTYPDFPPVDIDGDPRQYPAVDIGADEYRAPFP